MIMMKDSYEVQRFNIDTYENRQTSYHREPEMIGSNFVTSELDDE